MNEAEQWMQRAAQVAEKATCLRARCGAVVIKDGKVIGEGWNSPPKELESQRRCKVDKADLHPKVTDKTCCVHAEQRAILNALRDYSNQIAGSILYFTRIDEEGNLLRSGSPYCTLCSKLALESGIAFFVLWHEEGIISYPTDEYHLLSYQYQN